MSKTTKMNDSAVQRVSRVGRWTLLSGLIVLAACSGDSAPSLVESAKKHIDKKDSKAAVIELKNALQKDPQLAEARFLLGSLLLSGGDVVGAEVELQKAQSLNYPADKLVPLQAKVLLLRGQLDKLVSQYGKLTLQAQDSQAQLQSMLATAYLTQGKRAEAQAAVEAALRAEPGHIGAQLLQVRIFAIAKETKAAMEAIEKVIVAAPANSEARQLKGDLLLSTGDVDAALSEYKEAIERDKTNLGAHTSAVWVQLGKKDPAAADAQFQLMRAALPQHPQTRFFTALLALDKGDLKTAHEQSQQLLKQAPESVRALQMAGAVELRRGALVQAEANLAKALQLAPDQTRVRLLLAQTQMRAGEPGKAIKLLQPMISTSNPQWEAYALMAQALLMNGEPAKAEGFFAQASKLNPKDSRSRTALALAQMAKGRTEQGFDELRLISAEDEGPVADLALISAALRAKDYDRALKAIDLLEKKQPKQPMAANLRGQTELQRGRLDRARVAFEAALAIDPSYFPAASSLAGMDFKDGKPELARSRFEKMVAADEKNVRAAMALLALRAQTGSSKTEQIEQLGKIIKANPTEIPPRQALVGLHVEHKDFKAALAAAQDGLAASPDSPEMLDVLGQVQQLSGEPLQALSTYGKLANLQPKSPQPLMRMAEIQLAQKDTVAAAQSLKRALSLKPDYLPAQRGLMMLSLQSGKNKEAIDMARSVQGQRGDSVGFALEGDLYSAQKGWGDAARAYRAGLDKQPSSELAIKLHRSLLLGGKTDEALKLEQQWIKQHGKDVGFLYYLGDVALAKNSFEAARQYYEKVLQLTPENPAAMNNIAWILAKMQKPGALDMALKATKLAPKEPAFMDTLAEIYSKSGQLPKAIEIQEAAVAAGPETHLHRLHLARYYVTAGDKSKARKELDHLAGLGDKFAAQAEVKSLRDKL